MRSHMGPYSSLSKKYDKHVEISHQNPAKCMEERVHENRPNPWKRGILHRFTIPPEMQTHNLGKRTPHCAKNLSLSTDKSKNVNFATSRVKKMKIQPSAFYLWVYMHCDSKFSPTDPKLCGVFESELRFGFRARNGELKGSGVSGSKDWKSKFRFAKPKLSPQSDSAYRKPHSIIHFTHY